MHNPFEDILNRLEVIEAKLTAGPSSSTIPEDPIHIVDTEQLCEVLHLSTPTIIKLRKKGTIPFLQIGGAIRYDLRKVIKALETKKFRRDGSR